MDQSSEVISRVIVNGKILPEILYYWVLRNETGIKKNV